MPGALFVYGSLMTGFPNYYLLEPYVAAAEPATALGMELYLVTPWYPGMVRGFGEVRGELIAVNPAMLAEALQVLDALEEYHGPGNVENDYERVAIVVRTETGEDVPAWTYLWARGTEEYEHLPSGDWRKIAFGQG